MRTVLGVVRDLFPISSATKAVVYMRFPDAGSADATNPYVDAPILPFDVFAAAGQLLELSGAYHHIASIARAAHGTRRLEVSSDDLRTSRRIAKSWRAYEPSLYTGKKGASLFSKWLETEAGSGVAEMRSLWMRLTDEFGHLPVFAEQAPPDAPEPHECPAWWSVALTLFISADEAARGAGFNPTAGALQQSQAPNIWFENLAYGAFFELNYEAFFEEVRAGKEISPIITFSVADPDVLCVLPKARTPSVGCTMRSLSHNLALLPPRGVSKGTWMPFVFQTAPPDEMHMNILLVPFPFVVHAAAFEPKISEATDGQSTGVFSLKQEWLDRVTPTLLIDFIKALKDEATKEVDRIHAIVFPEMALNRKLYQELVSQLPSELPGVELLISGVSESRTGRHGNFVSMTVFQQDNHDVRSTTSRFGLTCLREKHHRWRLDGAQIVAYGLEGVMSASVGWWEDLDLLGRRVDFAVFRSGSVVSTMICEDLARVDPCQELIRAVGPSIIVALLMDAPQLKERWPARHATTLAEDPGSAVLTLTSKGLMNRQHRLRIHTSQGEKDRVIALWRDDSQSAPKEICCGAENYAVVLSLSGARVVDRTLDGRTDGSAVSWRYARHAALTVPNLDTMFQPLIGDR